MISPCILVTGAAGFIGSHVASRLGALGHQVVACDSFNDYYDTRLKHARVEALLSPRGITCERVDIADTDALGELIAGCQPGVIVHLAAQAGVRYSIENPASYVRSNLVGFANVLQAAQRSAVGHLLYASSSSVYGANTATPFVETQPTDAPVSFYAATKKANEVMAHSFSQIHGMRCTGLRFFTVYGPWGRPDMAYFSFAQRLVEGLPLPIFAEGKLLRDFTYIDDIVEGVVRLALSEPLDAEPLSQIYNIGNHRPITVLEFVRTLSNLMQIEPRMEFKPMQPGDVPVTCADVTRLHRRVGFEPSTPLDVGLARFVEWFNAWRRDPRAG